MYSCLKEKSTILSEENFLLFMNTLWNDILKAKLHYHNSKPWHESHHGSLISQFLPCKQTSSNYITYLCFTVLEMSKIYGWEFPVKTIYCQCIFKIQNFSLIYSSIEELFANNLFLCYSSDILAKHQVSPWPCGKANFPPNLPPTCKTHLQAWCYYMAYIISR